MPKVKSRAPVETWRPPIIAEIVGEGVRTWGGGQWNNEEVREAIIVLVAEGRGLKGSLEHLGQFGKMPSLWLVGKWLREIQGFKEAYDGALEVRGHVLVDEALDDVNGAASRDDATIAKVKAEHKRWMASKFSRKFTDRKIEEIEHTHKLSDNELQNQIHALLLDPEVSRALSAASKILDVEPEPPDQPTLSSQTDESQ